jgi:hypothetical protein
MGEQTETLQGGTGQQKAQDALILTKEIITIILFDLMIMTGKVK